MPLSVQTDGQLRFRYARVPLHPVPYRYFDESVVARTIDVEAERVRCARRGGDRRATQRWRCPFDLYTDAQLDELCDSMRCVESRAARSARIDDATRALSPPPPATKGGCF